MFILNLIVFIIVLGLVIFIHELGHFLLAKRAGILCHEFALGMGPVLWQKKVGETVYSLRVFPIGGYVMMAGEEINDAFVRQGQTVKLVEEKGVITQIVLNVTAPEFEDAPLVTIESFDLRGANGETLHINGTEVSRTALILQKDKAIQIAPYDRSFESKTLLQRFNAIFAGPLMNFILAFVLFVIVAMLSGFPVTDSNEVGVVSETLPAGAVLDVGDRIVAVEGEAIVNWDEFTVAMQSRLGVRNLTLTIARDDTLFDTVLNPRLFFYSVGFNSHPEATTDVRIGPVVSGTLAATAGIQENDVIVAVDGMAITSWQQLTLILSEEASTRTFTLARGDETVQATIEPYENSLLEVQGVRAVESLIGVSPASEFRFLPSFSQGALGVLGASTLIFDTLRLLFNSSQVGVGDLAGPIGIFTITAQASSQGLVVLLNWIGLLSVNLGILNLLPIPALDGGRIVFLGYETVSGKKVNKQFENVLHTVVLVLLLTLMLFVAFNDVLRLFN